MNWTKDNKEFKEIIDFPENCFGFVYIITNLKTEEYYIGRKYLFHSIKRKIGKKEKLLIEGKGRKPSFEKQIKESDWKTYWSSSKELQEDVKIQGEFNFKKEILEFAFTKRQLSYFEVKHQFIRDVLSDPKSKNDNISGKYFKKDLAL